MAVVRPVLRHGRAVCPAVGTAAERLRRVDDRRMDDARAQSRAFRAGEDAVEARSMIVAIAEHLLAAHYGGRARTEVLEPCSARPLDR